MAAAKTHNDMTLAVPKLCHGLEAHRRTQEGRLRSARGFLDHFFPHDDAEATDRIFRHLPRELRAPILTAWGLRGRKSAVRDTDEKVRSVVLDALLAGDLDEVQFEEALGPDVIVPWIDLRDWWRFWRSGDLPKYSISKALGLAFSLELFDAEWFLETIEEPSGKLRGTDVLAQGLSKEDLTAWVGAIYQVGDASPKGMLLLLGWDQIVAKSKDAALLGALDAMAVKVGLVKADEPVVAEGDKPTGPPATTDGDKPKAAPAKSELKNQLDDAVDALLQTDESWPWGKASEPAGSGAPQSKTQETKRNSNRPPPAKSRKG